MKPAGFRRQLPADHASRFIASMPDRFDGDHTSLGDIISMLRGRSIGFVFLILGIGSLLPIPGLPVGVVFGSVIMIAGLQLALGRRRFRIPNRLGRMRIQRTHLTMLTGRGAPFLRRLEVLLRPRLIAIASPRRRRMLGMMLILQGFLIALPIPLGNPPPAISVVLLSLGWLMRDGVAVLGGYVVGTAAVAWIGGLLAGGLWAGSELLAINLPF